MKRFAIVLLTLLMAWGLRLSLPARGARGGGARGGGQMAVARPVTRPAPSYGGSVSTLPSMPATRPAAPSAINKPAQLPSTRPAQPDLDAGFLRPSVDKPSTLPAPLPGGSLNKPGSGVATRLPATGISSPQRPSTLPAPVPSRPNWQGRPPAPNRADVVVNLPQINNNIYLHQHINNLPGGLNTWQNNRVGYWNNWYASRRNVISDHWGNHAARWDSIDGFRHDHADWIRSRTNEWRAWQASVWGYRLSRSYCVLDSARDFYCHLFTPDWWYGCGWWHRPVFGRPVNPWWWWRPFAWSSWNFVYAEPAPVPVTDDYGTDIVIEDGQVYVDGEPVASEAEYRAQAVEIGNPAAPPEPPAPAETEGAEAEWVPLGVWALTQESQGDAVMFYQLSLGKGGLISGAYTNVLTGGSDPVSGSVDKASQRVVWHTGDATATMVETNLNGLTGEQTAVFVHFPSGTTQTWLLVRLPSPDLPAAPISVDAKGGRAAAPSK